MQSDSEDSRIIIWSWTKGSHSDLNWRNCPYLLGPGVNKDEDLEDLNAPRYQPILNVTQKHIF